ncbi:unnamed protein product [Paramecium sonneborni]|uniref:Uncharacterized protein n=1 Tax=Paramecium sonneborni TaxID=65129 RepID=A0A8S1KLM7_9CILI|nr:unnamed protein product [Paramecium sonneborni]
MIVVKELELKMEMIQRSIEMKLNFINKMNQIIISKECEFLLDRELLVDYINNLIFYISK